VSERVEFNATPDTIGHFKGRNSEQEIQYTICSRTAQQEMHKYLTANIGLSNTTTTNPTW